jgi:hypothetical protein
MLAVEMRIGRNASFLHPGDGLARSPIEHEQLAEFGGLHQRGHRTLVARQVHQGGPDRQVVVPYIVVHGLEVPALLARLDVQRHEAAGISIVEGAPLAAVVIGRGVAEWQVYESEGGVGGIGSPGIRRATGVRFTGRQRRGR